MVQIAFDGEEGRLVGGGLAGGCKRAAELPRMAYSLR